MNCSKSVNKPTNVYMHIYTYIIYSFNIYLFFLISAAPTIRTPFKNSFFSVNSTLGFANFNEKKISNTHTHPIQHNIIKSHIAICKYTNIINREYTGSLSIVSDIVKQDSTYC